MSACGCTVGKQGAYSLLETGKRMILGSDSSLAEMTLSFMSLGMLDLPGPNVRVFPYLYPLGAFAWSSHVPASTSTEETRSFKFEESRCLVNVSDPRYFLQHTELY